MSRLHAAASLISLAACLAASLAGPAHAERFGKGRSLLLVGIGGHTGEFTYPGIATFRFETGEVGGEIAYYRFLSDQWTLGISGGYHASGRKTDENNPNGTPLSTETFDTHSFTVRVGGDRYAFIDDNVALYAGPGVFFTRGRAKSELTVRPPATGGGGGDGPDATEVGLNGRIGMYAHLGKGTALFGHIGQVLSRTSSKDSTGKISWWSSTHEGALGLALDF
jgi:hypothetical protein